MAKIIRESGNKLWSVLAAVAIGIFLSLILVRILEKNETLNGRFGSGQYFVTYGAIVNVVIWGVLTGVTRARSYLGLVAFSGLAASIAVIFADLVDQSNWLINGNGNGTEEPASLVQTRGY
ncbi:MAG: hypothetical protein FWF27_00980 [Candidatus Bathyarchaeota archaeon]|nr:hypothetical protein [Candidatus Termiticorpusculum sp.]